MRSNGFKGLVLRLSGAVIALGLPAMAQFAFDNPVSYPVTSDPHDVAIGDFDANGTMDLISTLHAPPSLAVLLGNDDGTFRAAQYTLLAGNVVPQGVLAPDLDADGLADVVVVSDITGQLIILHNLGNAQFTQIAQIPIGVGPTELCVADFDGDSDLDIAVSNTLGNNVAVVHNLGFGQFSLVQQVAVGVGPKALAAWRYFGESRVSLAVAVHDANAIYMLRNDGQGYFDVHMILTVPNGTNPECVVAADFDGDGDDDVAATFSVGVSNKVGVFYQNPAGGNGDFYNPFTAPYCFNVGAIHPTHLVAADFDLDARTDMAIVSSNAAVLSILRNLGDKSFGFQVMMNLPGPGSDHMQVADFDRDYYPDLVVTNDGGSSLSVVHNALGNPENFCVSVPNSTGAGAEIGMVGSTGIADNEFMLRVVQAPAGKLGLFVAGQTPTITPFHGSILCLEPPILRLNPSAPINARGVAAFRLPLALVGSGPSLGNTQRLYVEPGAVWNFQFVYRDYRGVGWPQLNTSNGLRVVFTP